MGVFSFKKKERLHLDGEFRKAFNEGKVFSNDLLKAYILFPPEREVRLFSRLGLVVSRKLGSSVQRHLIKRRLREIFRLSKPSFRRHADILLLPKSKSAGASYLNLKRKLTRIWEEAGLLRGNVHPSSK